MKAAYYARFGGPDVIRVGEVEAPVPAPGEVLIRVRAAAVNPVDWKIREAWLKNYLPFAFPIIPGWDAAGEVAGLGEGVTGFHLGERVMAYVRKPVIQWGAYAEYVTMPADVVIPTPTGLSDRQAASLPLVGITAWQGLVRFANLQPGQSVLIPAATGGVGSVAVPLAKALGARVITTCSAANLALARTLGSDLALDYAGPDWLAKVGPVDAVFDLVGGETLSRMTALVRDGGAICGLNDGPDEVLCAARGIRATRLFATPHGDDLRGFMALVTAGKIPLPEITALPLDAAAEAMELNKAGHTRGKIVLDVA
jgi:NADPH2:quinone reductase